MAGIAEYVRCEICEEMMDLEDEVHIGHGAFAEMYNPENPAQNGVVHAECGLAAGWKLS